MGLPSQYQKKRSELAWKVATIGHSAWFMAVQPRLGTKGSWMCRTSNSSFSSTTSTLDSRSIGGEM